MMNVFNLVILVLFNLNKVYCYTTTRSYDLQVPGSDPIRIIETEPLWDRSRHEEEEITTPQPWTGVEHRALKPIRKMSKQKISRYENEDELDEITENRDSSEELKEFLKKYSDQIKRPTFHEDEEEESRSTPFHQVELVTRNPQELTNRLANLYLDKDEEDTLVMNEKPKSWNVLNVERHKHPTSGKNGWVSLEVVPWSVSKVAKWHSNSKPVVDKIDTNKYYSNSQRPTYDEPSSWDNSNKYYNFNSNPDAVKPKPSLSRPVKNSYKPNSGSAHQHQNKPFEYGAHSVKKHTIKQHPPTAIYGNKVHVQQEEPNYTDELPRPSWGHYHQSEKKHHQQNSYAPPQQDDYEDNNEEYDQNPNGDIITDGLPSNFPKSHQPQAHNRRKGSSSNEHPMTHPFYGNGEWVLLTTTKGFKPPGNNNNNNNKQRSLTLDLQPISNIESINSHQSVRLTVLPPTKESRINMTTSHGGLLQVESTFQTVDEAHRMSLKKQNLNKTPYRKKINKLSSAAIASIKNELKATKNPNRRKPNPSTVLAAVGAGMIPATMAMLVPMALGKKRRRRDLNFKLGYNNKIIRQF